MKDHNGFILHKACNGLGCAKCDYLGTVPMFMRRPRLMARKNPLAAGIAVAVTICVAVWIAYVIGIAS
ncbi:MAG: hypothetical protein AAGM33_11700 [Pseudomonadota bacterium]